MTASGSLDICRASDSAWRRPIAFRCTPGSRPDNAFPTMSVSPWRMSQKVVMVISLDLRGAMRGGVFGEHPGAGAQADLAPLVVGHIAQASQRVVWRRREQDLAAGFEKRLQAIPVVADDRDGARSSFEQPHAGRVAGRDHFRAGHVQSEALGCEEAAVQLRLEVNFA